MEQDSNLIDQALMQANLAKGLTEDERAKIAHEVIEMYELDERSREPWLKQNEDWMKLALQVVERKSFPWKNASNVKYPLLTVAALQFASRAYPALVNSKEIVKAKVFGADPTGELAGKAEAISKHMSYQLLYEVSGWEEDMDKICYILPIIGTCFKKIYYDPTTQTNCSELVLPKDLVVNYWAKDLSSARKTHKLYYTSNRIKELAALNYYLDIDATKDPGTLMRTEHSDLVTKQVPFINGDDKLVPRLIIEQHTWLDLDKDGYAEPYIVTVDKESGKLLRIGARFRKNDVKRVDNKLVSIKPCEYFVKYTFLPNPDGGFYGAGFGLLLGGINEALNTLINQLIDAGTLNNLQAGFMSKGIRINKGPMEIGPGEWVPVNNFGDDLRKGIFPLPTKEPSPVLFNLLGVLASTGKEIASVSEVFTGKFPGQNTPASTTSAVIEEGMKVFTSIHKRIHATVGQEFRLFYKNNQVYLPQRVEFTLPIAGTDATKNYVVRQEDYTKMPMQGEAPQGDPFISVILGSDPSMINDSQKVLKVQQLMEIQSNLGTLNPLEITKVAMDTIDIENKQALMTPPPPSTPPEIQLKQAELQELVRSNKAKEQIEQMTLISESRKRESEAVLNYAKAQQLGDATMIEQTKMEAERVKTEEESLRRQMEMAFKIFEHKMDMQQQQEAHGMDMQLKQVEGEQKLVQNERMAQAKEEQMKRQASMRKANAGTPK
jgi:chaperonin GroES